MVRIKQQLVSHAVEAARSYGGKNPVNYITIHNTGNMNNGANAQMHANLQSNLNGRQASWHYQVDDKEAIQSFPDDAQAWHAGDGRGPGNTQSIAIEICINSDGDYTKAVRNAAELTNFLMEKHRLGKSRIKQHNRWDGKNCPAQLRANYKGISWNDFLVMVDGGKGATLDESPRQTPGDEGVTWVGTDLKGLRVESIYEKADGLNFYDSPRWYKPNGQFFHKEGWIVDNKYYVKDHEGEGYQYRVQNSDGDLYFITAHEKYVRVEGASGGKSISQMADEVIAGKHGQGHSDRRRSLGISQSLYEKVRAEVNSRF